MMFNRKHKNCIILLFNGQKNDTIATISDEEKLKHHHPI